MINEFEMSDLDEMQYFLGMQVKQSPGGIFITQTKYVDDLWVRFAMKDCRPVETLVVIGCKLMKEDSSLVDATLYNSLVGSLLYLTATRPNAMFVVILVVRFMHSPHESQWKVAKRILRYVSGTKSFGLWYKVTNSSDLEAYIDVEWARCLDDGKSTSGYAFIFGKSLVSWSNKK